MRIRHKAATLIESPENRPDRLSALIGAFALSARPVALDDPGAALFLVGAPMPQRLVLRARPGATAPPPGATAAAAVDFGGPVNPLTAALPDALEIDLSAAPDMLAVATAFAAESATQRCGRGATLARLAEVMVVMALRRAIDSGATGPGLLAGLAHPQIYRALAAIHDAPATPWRVADLARLSGMSRSHFMALFRETLGRTPAAYLAGWRLTLARRDLGAGRQVQDVARRAGFGSSAAFSRAFRRAYGVSPTAMAAPAAA